MLVYKVDIQTTFFASLDVKPYYTCNIRIGYTVASLSSFVSDAAWKLAQLEDRLHDATEV